MQVYRSHQKFSTENNRSDNKNLNGLLSPIIALEARFIVTSTADAISAKSILAATIEGSRSVYTSGMEAAVVSSDGTLVDI